MHVQEISQPLSAAAPWPRAILHLDADAFFASVAQAIDPALKGKPVVTGVERGMVIAASYEAKTLGVDRGMLISEAKRKCRGLIALPGDYAAYSLFSKRMFAIMRRFSPDVEEYSIDEAFADLTGLERMHPRGYVGIAEEIQTTVHRELDIGVSVGVSVSKTLAKLCSKRKKPRGCVIVPAARIPSLLSTTAPRQVWGIGPSTAALLAEWGCKTALDVVQMPLPVLHKRLGKLGEQLWRELRGEVILSINPAAKTDYLSISKTQTFTPPSRSADDVFAQLLQNLENACAKARRYQLVATQLGIMLKTQRFTVHTRDTTLLAATNAPLDCTAAARALFATLFSPGTQYRATGVTLAHLRPSALTQCDLFENPERPLMHTRAAQAVDHINTAFGRGTIRLGESTRVRARHFHGSTTHGRIELLHR